MKSVAENHYRGRFGQWLSVMGTAALSVMITACASGPADPHSGGFMGGLKGIYSGAYDQRIEQKQADLNREQEVTRALKAEFDIRERAYKDKAAELKTQQQRLDAMAANIKGLNADIGRVKGRSEQDATKLTDLKIKFRKLQTEVDQMAVTGGDSTDSEQYKVLEQKRDTLAMEYSSLLEYYNSLSATTQ